MKKGLIAALVVSPLAAGVIASVVITTTMVNLNNKSNQEIKSESVESNALTNYQMLEMSGEEVNYFNGNMPLSLEQVQFINENNNGITFEDLKDNYIKNEKVLVTDAVKKEIVDNYYTKGFFSDTTLEFRAYNQVVPYPQEALDLVVEGDKESFQKVYEKIIELWKAKKFKFPWELKAADLQNNQKAPEPKVDKPKNDDNVVLPQPIEGLKPLTPGQLKYYNNTFPLSPDQVKFVDENNGKWTVAMIRKADSEGKSAYATKAVSDEIIGKYFKKADISVFKDNLKQVVWNGKAVNYPSSVLTETTIRKRAEAIIALWKEGNFKFPWEDGAQLVPLKGETAAPVTKPEPTAPTTKPEPAKPEPTAPTTKPEPATEPVSAAEMENMTKAKMRYMNGTFILPPELIKYINDNNEQKYEDMKGLKEVGKYKLASSVYKHVEKTYQAMFSPARMTSAMKKLSLVYNGVSTDLTPEELDAVIKTKAKTGKNYWETISDLARAGTVKLPWYTKK